MSSTGSPSSIYIVSKLTVKTQSKSKERTGTALLILSTCHFPLLFAALFFCQLSPAAKEGGRVTECRWR